MPYEQSPRMTAPKSNTTSDRLTAVETDMRSLRTEFHTFAQNSDARMEGLSRSIRDGNEKTDKQIEKIGEILASRGKIQPQTIVAMIAALATWSVVLASAVWFLVGLGHEPTKVRLEMLNEQFRSHGDNHGHPKMVAEVAAIEKAMEARQAASEARAERIKRLEEWYNGHGQRIAQDVIRVESQIKALEPIVSANSGELARVEGNRFNSQDALEMERRIVKQVDTLENRVREDYPPQWLIREVEQIEAIVLQILSTRFGPEDAKELLRKVERDIDRLDESERASELREELEDGSDARS